MLTENYFRNAFINFIRIRMQSSQPLRVQISNPLSSLRIQTTQTLKDERIKISVSVIRHAPSLKLRYEFIINVFITLLI